MSHGAWKSFLNIVLKYLFYNVYTVNKVRNELISIIRIYENSEGILS
jgi:hypothetical protein